MTITSYDEAEALVRRLNDQDGEPSVFTGSLRAEWEAIALSEYPDTEKCDNTDLRIAFVYGALAGYSLHAFITDPPPAFDRMQGDAFIAGVQEGERRYERDGWLDDDDDDEVYTYAELEDCHG